VVLVEATITQCIKESSIDGGYSEFAEWVDNKQGIIASAECSSDYELKRFMQKHKVSNVLTKLETMIDTSYSIGAVGKDGWVTWMGLN